MSGKRWETATDAEVVPIVPAIANNYGTTDDTTETVIIDEPQPSEFLYGALAVENESGSVRGDNDDDDDADNGPVFRDIAWAILFWLHLGVILYLSVTVAPRGLHGIHMKDLATEIQVTATDDVMNVSPEDYQTMVQLWEQAKTYIAVYPKRILNCLILPSCLMAFIISFATTNFIKSFPHVMVTSSLLVPLVTVSLAVLTMVAVFSPSAKCFWFSVAVSLAVLGMVVFFVVPTWNMIPYAAVNLSVALEGINSNLGTYVLAFFVSELNSIWFFAWLAVTIGVLSDQEQQCPTEPSQLSPPPLLSPLPPPPPLNADPAATLPPFGGNFDSDELDACGQMQGWTLFFLLISLYWTSTVIANSLQVTVAGVMATWCFDKRDARGCCSPAVYSSLYRSVTYSFGSICFGSLAQAVVSAFRCVLHSTRANQRDNVRDRSVGSAGFMLCILECLATLLDEVVRYINEWAFVFVGVYGYSYRESGKKVMELFQSRGWTTLITNGLVDYVLGFTTFTVGIMNGVASIIIEASVTAYHRNKSSDLAESTGSFIFGPLPGWRLWAFGIGFIVGVAVCSVMMEVIQGAVNTLIVCWADAPSKLEENHPVATRAMAKAWGKAFPESVVFFSQQQRQQQRQSQQQHPFEASMTV